MLGRSGWRSDGCREVESEKVREGEIVGLDGTTSDGS